MLAVATALAIAVVVMMESVFNVDSATRIPEGLE